jgi:hypothetical protein
MHPRCLLVLTRTLALVAFAFVGAAAPAAAATWLVDRTDDEP